VAAVPGLRTCRWPSSHLFDHSVKECERGRGQIHSSRRRLTSLPDKDFPPPCYVRLLGRVSGVKGQSPLGASRNWNL
jgi:hypothetical protein